MPVALWRMARFALTLVRITGGLSPPLLLLLLLPSPLLRLEQVRVAAFVTV